jgi:hypothetical protein
LCKSLAHVLHGAYENRGKLGFEALLARARTLGARRLLLVYESKGNPARLAFAEVNARSWSWLGEMRISVAGIRDVGKLPAELSVIGENGAEMGRLLGVGEPETEDAVVLEAGKDALRFMYRGVEVGPVLKVKTFEGAHRG